MSASATDRLPLRTWLPRDLPRLGLAFALFGVVGASLGLLGPTLTMSGTGTFLIKNTALPAVRGLLFGSLAAGAAAAVLAPFVFLLAKRERAVDAVVRLADVLSPLSLAAIIPALFAFRAWSDNTLLYLLLLGAFVVTGEQLVHRSLRALPSFLTRGMSEITLGPKAARWIPFGIVCAAALGYAIYFSYYTILNHKRFGTAGFDLGINVNWCYNAMKGHPFRTTVLFGPSGGSMIAGHAIFAMFLWLPVFMLKPGAEVLLVYQSVMCAAAAIPLYLFAKTLLPKPTAVLIAIAYLLYAPLHGPNFYDFHELPVAIFFHFWLYYVIATERYKWVPVLLVILFAHREDVAVGIAILGTFLMLTGLRPRLGLLMSVTSVIWFFLIKFVIMPLAGSWWFAGIYKDLMPDGKGGYGGVVQTMLVNPIYFVSTVLKEAKLVYFLHLFAPLAFLPLRRPILAFLAFPGFFFTLMTTGYAPTISIAFQYTTHWVPYLFLTSVIAIRILGDLEGPSRRQAAAVALGFGVLAHSVSFGAVFQHETFVGGFSRIIFTMTDAEKQSYAAFNRLAAMIPQSASVAATESEISHVAARKDAYTLKDHHGDAEYLLIRAGAANKTLLDEAFARNAYGLLARHEKTFYLFKKGHVSPETALAKAELGIR